MNKDFAKFIDHTVLKADAKKEEIVELCEEAKMYSFASVCINPTWVKTAAAALEGSSVKVCTVIGFPLGASTSEVKAFETKNAIENGATEIDMVINIGALRDGDDETVKKDIASVVEAAKDKAIVKVIIETSLLTDNEKRTACELAVVAGADFVKTSTGFSTGGATEEDVKLMRAVVGPVTGVKASGGVRSFEDMQKMINAGATRIGASSGVQIMSGLKSETDY
ncbi:deoxyribose-phosphate aldolase [Sporosarcina sp. Marseille-Q4063]|uniref:deoxyribose-phosphate aldolase n=1 Tax=Sporosarcina sp. Marseille-Q4063 TaxID=2810514 RepID=UPI001BB00EA6|nr:deoxyribose-phosphate aldolase [Sporosarcina sp. Marseille-Q4063]QUW22211.1 deoxyribose-phosphate aldolase [Sporosarcina sp. Marseille-Q4063]